jgi:rhodanese-related sulfurtransferase
VAQFLSERGFRNVHPLIGGFDAWQEAELAVEGK